MFCLPSQWHFKNHEIMVQSLFKIIRKCTMLQL
jgi:hypothetical protein